MGLRWSWLASNFPRGCPRVVVRAPPARQRRARLRSDNDARDSIPRSLAYSSRSHPPGRPSPLQDLPRSWSCPTARSDLAHWLPRGPTLSSFVRADDVSSPATHVLASLAAHACDSREGFPFVVATRPRGDIRSGVFLRGPRQSVRVLIRRPRCPPAPPRIAHPPTCLP